MRKRKVRRYWEAYEEGWNEILRKLKIRNKIDQETFDHWILEDMMYVRRKE